MALIDRHTAVVVFAESAECDERATVDGVEGLYVDTVS